MQENVTVFRYEADRTDIAYKSIIIIFQNMFTMFKSDSLWKTHLWLQS